MGLDVPAALVGAVKSGRWPVPDTVTLRVWHPCGLDAVRRARAEARRFAAREEPAGHGVATVGLMGADVVDDVVMVTSELAANAVLHARGVGFWLTLTRSPGTCTVAVEDTGSAGTGSPTFPAGNGTDTPSPTAGTSGRGLAIVAALCPTDHGYAPADSGAGFVVWGTVCWRTGE